MPLESPILTGLHRDSPFVASEIVRLLESKHQAIAQAVVDRQCSLHPEFELRFSAADRQKCVEDTSSHLAHLIESLAASRPELFREYIAWAKVLLIGRGIPVGDLADNLRAIIIVLKEQFDEIAASAVCDYVEAAIAELPRMPEILPGAIAQGTPLTRLAESYLKALLACERNKASRLILDAVRNGTSIKEIYVQVFQQTQQEIGRLWQTNQVTVAQEHYCTAATQMIMSQLYPQIFAGPRDGRTFVGTSVSGNLHEMGIRIIADFFEMDGWDTVFLGASVPIADLIKTLQDRKPNVVGISATMTIHIKTLGQMIASIHAAAGCENIKILVGGFPFLIVPDLWKQVGADGSCSSAQGAVDLANQLTLKREAA